jgi:hypothetical protein
MAIRGLASIKMAMAATMVIVNPIMDMDIVNRIMEITGDINT